MLRLTSLILVLSLVAFASAVPIQEGAVRAPPSAVNEVEGPICDECKKIVGALLEAAKSANATYQQKLETYLDDNICDKLPVEYTKSCRSTVTVDVPVFWEQIIKELMDPVITCEKMMLCAEEEKDLDQSPDFACDVCMKAAKYIDEQVFESAKVDKKVATHLKKLCTDIPDIKVRVSPYHHIDISDITVPLS